MGYSTFIRTKKYTSYEEDKWTDTDNRHYEQTRMREGNRDVIYRRYAEQQEYDRKLNG